ncbi:MAG: histidine phosphatase family protein [Erysipelotrichaceae bacterium]|nr:histidine phosphatase family protein [Erysipelotrichaceae bacterium]
MKKLYLLRHGETKLNSKGITQGRIDEPLSDAGLNQAYKVAENLKKMGLEFSDVYSSPLNRAIVTARIVSDLEPVVYDELIEQDYGSLDGLDYELTRPYHFDFSEVGGESRKQVGERYYQRLMEIMHQSGDMVLVVGHASAFKAFIEYIGQDVPKHVPNCALFDLDYDGSGFFFNQLISKLDE